MPYEATVSHRVQASCDLEDIGGCPNTTTSSGHTNIPDAKAELKGLGWSLGNGGKAFCPTHSETKRAKELRATVWVKRKLADGRAQSPGWRNW